MLLIQVESQQLVARESVVTVGTLDLVQPFVLNFNVAAQVVLAQALLRAQVTVVDGLNLEKKDQNGKKDMGRTGKKSASVVIPGENGGTKDEA